MYVYMDSLQNLTEAFLTGAEGRTRTGTPSLTADFEFIQAVFRRFDFKLTTTLKVADFTGTKAASYGVSRPVLPRLVFNLGSQKVVKIFTSNFVDFSNRPAPA